MLRPESQEIQLRIGDLLQALNRPNQAVEHYKQALLRLPDSVEIQLSMGNTLQILSRHEEALLAIRHVLSLSPGNVEAYDCIGYALAELGDGDGARQSFKKALQLEPTRTKSLFGLANAYTIAEDDPILAVMHELAKNVNSLPIFDQVQLHFALGKALADVGEHGLSFAHLLEGNTRPTQAD